MARPFPSVAPPFFAQGIACRWAMAPITCLPPEAGSYSFRVARWLGLDILCHKFGVAYLHVLGVMRPTPNSPAHLVYRRRSVQSFPNGIDIYNN
jgi:hypothetical protein